MPKKIKEGEITNNTSFKWSEVITYKYGISFAKLYQAIGGKEVKDYESVANLSEDNKLLKLNLYPINFKSTDSPWKKYNLHKTTGFEHKYLFNTWCFFNRFRFFVELRKKHNPKLIICTGVSYLCDFLMFFGGSENINPLQTGELKAASKNNQYPRTYYYVQIDKTLLVVTPFFSGRYGLNSNYLLQTMGEKIAELLEEVK